MDKRTFFLKAIEAGRLKDKRWILNAFSVVDGKLDYRPEVKPFDIFYHANETTQLPELHCVSEMGEWFIPSDVEYLPDAPQPMYRFNEKITLKPGDLANVVEPTKTTYGNVLVNWLLLVYPFGNRIPFMTGKIKIKAIEAIIEDRMVDGDGEPEDPNAITVKQYLQYRTATSLLDGLTQLAVPSMSPKSMTGHPDRYALRARLLQENKDRLHDPATVAKIDAELVKLDKEWLSGDAAEGFYFKDKSYTNVRKKTMSMYGIETAFGDGSSGVLIEKSLSEGWDIEKLPEMINTLREGSFDRGASTALGGEAVKFILRVMQNANVEGDDCGATTGVPMTVTDGNKDDLAGNTIIVNGKMVVMEKATMDQYVGKSVVMRSPLFCKAPRDNFCKTCIGGRYAEHPTGLATAASGIGSTLMAIFMAATHVSEVKVAKYSLKDSMT